MEKEPIRSLQNGQLEISNAQYRIRKEAMENIDKNTPLSEKLYTIGLSLLMGILFDYFFIDKNFGVSVPLYTVILTAFFLWSARERFKVQRNIGWFLLIPVLLLSLCFSIFSNGVLAGINALLLPLLMICSSILIFNPEVKWDSIKFVWKVLDRALVSVLENCFKPFRFLSEEVKRTNYKTMSKTKWGIIKGLLISLPLLAVILGLLTSADMVFSYYITNITYMFKDIRFDSIIGHSISISVIFIYLFGYVWSFKYDHLKAQDNVETARSWEPATLITVVAMLNIVYLLFTIVQFSYLYGGAESSLPKGFTYSEYARKGFFELVAVTVINFAVILSTMSFIKRENVVASRIANVLLTVLIIFTFNMLYSAHFKMSLYESSYGYTYLRVFVHYFMILLVLLLIAALIGIWKRSFPFVKTMIITSLVMYVLLNYLNVDGFIARKNIERYKNGAKIDISYLTRLSYDALPYLEELQNDSNTDVSLKIQRYLEQKKKTLDRKRSWSEFNLSMHKAKAELGR